MAHRPIEAIRADIYVERERHRQADAALWDQRDRHPREATSPSSRTRCKRRCSTSGGCPRMFRDALGALLDYLEA